MTFENHTECRCISKSLLSSTRIESSPLPNDEPAYRLNKNLDPPRSVLAAVNPVIVSDQQTTTETTLTTSTESAPNCRCPNNFTQINGSECKCDCTETPRPSMDICIKLKTGLEHFSIIERRQVLLHLKKIRQT